MTTKLNTTKGNTDATGDRDELWSSDDVARFLGCSTRHIFNLRKRGLPHYRIGDMIRFVPCRVIDWLENCDAPIGGGNHDERARQLAHIATENDNDAAECATADLSHEFPADSAVS